MLIGRDYEISVLRNLKERGKLSGSFLFFGGKGVGKFSCAEMIAREIEEGKTLVEGSPKRTLSECLVIKPDEKGSIGIDLIRNMKIFLSLRPVSSSMRVVIVDDADKMTDPAANAALKIVEEPPENSLVVLIARDPDALPATLVSRLKKIYFPPVPKDMIASWLMEECELDDGSAKTIASESFGCPEFALEIVLAAKKKRKAKVDFKFDSSDEYEAFIRKSTSALYNDKDRDFANLREFCRRTAAMGEWNTNKKLQLQTIKWTL